MRPRKPPPEPKLPSATEVMLTEGRYDDYCKLCVDILKVIRTDSKKLLSHHHMHHLNHKMWIKTWYLATEEFRETYRKRYPQMFIAAPPTTIPWIA